MERVGIAIAVPTQLQPATQLSVMRHQEVRPRCIEQPGRTGNMSAATLSGKAVCMRFYEANELLDDGLFLGVALHIALQRRQE